MTLKWFGYRLAARIWLMCLFRPRLRELLEGKVAVIDLQVGEQQLLLEICNGQIQCVSTSTEINRVKIEFRSVPLAQNVVNAAIRGDQFWLTAMRDRRVVVSGDMSIVLWFFAACRHLAMRPPPKDE